MESYRDLQVWQKAMDLAVEVYRVTKQFPREEMFGLTSQIRRAASSVPANIAEGWGRETSGGYIQFLRIAQGSLKELETHLLLAQRVELCPYEPIQILLDQIDQIGRMLRALLRTIQARNR